MPRADGPRGGRRLLVAFLALVVLAIVALVVRVATIAPENTSIAGPAHYARLLGGDREAFDACLDPAVDGLSGGYGLVPERSVDAIAADVERIRLLEFDGLPEVKFVTPLGMRVLLRRPEQERAFRAGLEDLDRVLTMLGAIEDTTALRQLYRGQPAGVYLPRRENVLVRASRDPPDTWTRIVVAHELAHALVDQRLGLPGRRGKDGDERLAIRALFEGDATLAELRFTRWAITAVERFVITSAESTIDPGAVDSRYVAREASFPYVAGPAFVCQLFEWGGWQVVNAAFAEPPTTSAQILFPGRYVESEGPLDASDPPSPGSSWELKMRDTFGAAHLLWLFEAPGNDPEVGLDRPLERAAGWAGGEIRLWSRGDESALTVALVQRPGESSLCGSMASWYTAAFPDDDAHPTLGEEEWLVASGAQASVVACRDDEVRLAIAPRLRLARALTAWR